MFFDALSYFKCLEADPSTDINTLKLKYRDKAKFWHPDHNKNPEALENFQLLSKAYEVLKNNKSKTAYLLLSLIYTKENFPAIERLKPYLDAKNKENAFVRVFHIQKISKNQIQEDKLIGSYDDLADILSQATRHNLKNGLLSLKFFQTLKHNLKQVNLNASDQQKLLVHNAVAYFMSDKLSLAALSAKQAIEFSNPKEQEVLQEFLNQLPETQQKLQSWNFQKLRQVQLKPLHQLLYIFMAIVILILALLLVPHLFSPNSEKINYYQTVQLNSGEEILDDLVTSKIFNIAIDKTDNRTLYHLKQAQDIMHGPSKKFDVLARAKRLQTVRITGYTPDGLWYRVMLDNGEMGFVQKQDLKKGIGLEIPSGSQLIIQNNE